MTLIIAIAAFAAGVAVDRRYPQLVDKALARIRSIRE